MQSEKSKDTKSVLRLNVLAELSAAAASVMILACEKRLPEPSARPEGRRSSQSASASKEGVPLPDGAGMRASGRASANDAETMVKTNVLGTSGYLVVPSSGNPKFWVWRPEERTLEEFEKGLGKSGAIDAKIVERLGKFVRQYSGILVNGEKVLQVDFYCEPPKGIDQHPVFVTDWVGCQASVEYFPNRRLYRNFIGTVP